MAAAQEDASPPPEEVVERVVLTSFDDVQDLMMPMEELLRGTAAEEEGQAFRSMQGDSDMTVFGRGLSSPSAAPIQQEDVDVQQEEEQEEEDGMLVIEDVVLTSADSVEDLVLPLDQVIGVSHAAEVLSTEGVGSGDVLSPASGDVGNEEEEETVFGLRQEGRMLGGVGGLEITGEQVVEEMTLSDDDVVEDVVMDLDEVRVVVFVCVFCVCICWCEVRSGMGCLCTHVCPP